MEDEDEEDEEGVVKHPMKWWAGGELCDGDTRLEDGPVCKESRASRWQKGDKDLRMTKGIVTFKIEKLIKQPGQGPKNPRAERAQKQPGRGPQNQQIKNNT